MKDIDTTGDTLEAAVLLALSGITVGEGGPDVVSAGHVAAVAATSGAVRVLIDPALVDADQGEALAEALRQVVGAAPGVERVVVKPRPRPLASLLAQAPGAVLAVHSGKGGVGKSTIAVNLAAALAHGAAGRRMRVGLLDADVYGPSAPLLLGVSGRAGTTADGTRIAPLEGRGIKVMSLGFLMPEGKALAWRGALVDAGLAQLIADVEWGDLDVRVVDLPPGTSDVHLALARAAPVAGACDGLGRGWRAGPGGGSARRRCRDGGRDPGGPAGRGPARVKPLFVRARKPGRGLQHLPPRPGIGGRVPGARG